MSFLRINVSDESKPFIEELLSKLGCEVSDEGGRNLSKRKKNDISPTFLFGKWKDTKLNPQTFRKDLWARRK